MGEDFVTANTRLPERIEKHGHWWFVMGIERFQVGGVDHYAYGGYDSKKEAEQAWSSLVRSVKRWDPEWVKVIHEVPTNYRPEQYEVLPDRKVKKRRKLVVASQKHEPGKALDSGAAATSDAAVATREAWVASMPVETGEWGTNWVDNVTERCTCVAE